METKYITIKQNNSLLELRKYSTKPIGVLVDRMISVLSEYNVVHDFPEDCGLTLEYALEQSGFDLEVFAIYCFCASTPRLLEILKGIKIWGLADDCEECGCEMEEEETENVCMNPVCGCTIQTVWERDPDEYRDDCKISNPMRLNKIHQYNLN